MARECGLPSWVLRIEARFDRSYFFEKRTKHHLGGPHLRAMTGLFVIPTDHSLF
jgi:hypothetical protein